MATSVSNNNAFWGMVIYERRGDGNLHGEWKNNRLSNDSILSEIATKNNNQDQIQGTYTVTWIEEDGQPHIGSVFVNQIENNTALSFIWQENNVEVFRGMGMPIGLNRIAVIYWNTKSPLQLSF